MSAPIMNRAGLRLALQGLIAAGLAEIVGNQIDPGRSYWAAYTAVSVLIGTWGETILLGVRRTLATALGIACGTLLYRLVAPWPELEVAAFAAGFFLMGYAGGSAYLWLIFGISVLLAMLISIVVPSPDQVLVARIVLIGVGAVIGILVSALVLPTPVARRLTADAAALVEMVGAGVADALAGRFAATAPTGTDMVQASAALRGFLDPLRAEGALVGRSRAALMRRVVALELVAGYGAELREAALQARDGPLFAATAAERERLAGHLQEQAGALAAGWRGGAGGAGAAGTELDGLQQAMLARVGDEAGLRRELLVMTPLVFLAHRLDEAMQALAGELDGHHRPTR